MAIHFGILPLFNMVTYVQMHGRLVVAKFVNTIASHTTPVPNKEKHVCDVFKLLKLENFPSVMLHFKDANGHLLTILYLLL